MKKLFILLSSFVIQAQEIKEISVYVPLYTIHTRPYLSQVIDYHESYLGSEGGQGGAVLSIEYTDGLTQKAGVYQNSWGDLGWMFLVGKAWHLGKLTAGLEVGGLFGYRKFHKRKEKRLRDLGVYRNGHGNNFLNLQRSDFYYAMTSYFRYPITDKVRTEIYINPAFIGAGLNFKIK